MRCNHGIAAGKRQIHNEGLMVCAQAHGEWEQLEELKSTLQR